MIEDLEIISEVPREGFHLHPEENGATIYGPMRIREQTRRGLKTIHCQDDVGQAGYTIPNNVESIEFVDHDAKFVIAMETGGMYDRLIENGFDEEYNAILVHLKGQPARSTRRMLNKISTHWNLPILVFTDGDPWSYRIYASVAYGAIKSAHMSELLATPKAQFLGLAAKRYPGLQPALRQIVREGCRGSERGTDRSPVCDRLLEKADQFAARAGTQVRTAGVCGPGAGLCDEEVFAARLSEMGILKN